MWAVLMDGFIGVQEQPLWPQQLIWHGSIVMKAVRAQIGMAGRHAGSAAGGKSAPSGVGVACYCQHSGQKCSSQCAVRMRFMSPEHLKQVLSMGDPE